MRRLIGRRILDMSKAKFLLPIIALMSLSACSSNNPVSSTFDPIIDDPVFVDHSLNKPNKSFNNQQQKLKEEYVSSLNEFALDFYSAISSKENSVFSPVSIATCYSMLYDGALENSKEELKKMLHFGDSFNHLEEIQKMLLNTAINDAKNGVTLDLAQSLWIDDDFAPRINQEYVSKMEEYYYAEAYQGALDSDEMHAMLADYINKKTTARAIKSIVVISVIYTFISNLFFWGFLTPTWFFRDSAARAQFYKASYYMSQIENPTIIYYLCGTLGIETPVDGIPATTYWATQIGATDYMMRSQTDAMENGIADFIVAADNEEYPIKQTDSLITKSGYYELMRFNTLETDFVLYSKHKVSEPPKDFHVSNFEVLLKKQLFGTMTVQH